MFDRTFIIAEAGVNHNGSMELALRLVDAASQAGADAVKFQTFKAEKLVRKDAEKAAYQKKSTGAEESQYEMLKKLELAEKDFVDLKVYCDRKGIMFLSSAFDGESAEFLNSTGMAMFKIPSGEITNLPYLRKIGSFGKPVILSTGMSYLYEVADAVAVFDACGLPRQELSILHCSTEYPALFHEVNLKAMHTMLEAFPDVTIGYSDHTPGIEIPIAAVALGAKVIEKHFTLDRNMHGPDHKASLEPDELAAMVSSIRNTEAAAGNGIKVPCPSELPNRLIVRKSIVARTSIKKDEVFSSGNLTVKRPGNGISPMMWNRVIGQAAKRDYNADDEIEF